MLSGSFMGYYCIVFFSFQMCILFFSMDTNLSIFSTYFLCYFEHTNQNYLKFFVY